MLIQENSDYVRAGKQKQVYAAGEVIQVPCPLCGETRHHKIYEEHGAIGIVRCVQCELIYVSPRIESPEEIYWGAADKYYDEARLIFDGKAPHHRDPSYLEELDLIERFQPTGRFLDVGCNMGMLLRHARKRRWQVCGVEPSPTLSKLGKEKFGLEVFSCFLNELPENEERSFDVVALSDVFEHISKPRPFLAEARRFLSEKGLLYVKVPNARWNLFKQQAIQLMGKKPSAGLWDSYEHVVHYTDETLRKMLHAGGFEVVHMTFGLPIQVPSWQHHVGHYYQYPSPWLLDWKRHLGRSVAYYLSYPERLLRGGSIGAMAPNLVALARKSR